MNNRVRDSTQRVPVALEAQISDALSWLGNSHVSSTRSILRPRISASPTYGGRGLHHQRLESPERTRDTEQEHRRAQGLHHFSGRRRSGGGPGVMFGVLTQLAACGLILIMLGAIQKKIFVWHTGFWGEKGYGWHYDLMFVVMNLVTIF